MIRAFHLMNSSRLKMRMPKLKEWMFVLVLLGVIGLVLFLNFSSSKGSYRLANYASRQIVHADRNNWARAIEDEQPIHDRPFKPLVLLRIGSVNGHLEGSAVLFNPHESPATFEAMKAPDNETWLTFTAQVSNHVKGTWRTLEAPTVAREAVSIIVPAKGNIDVSMNFEIFRAWINKYSFGRVMLKTGETAIFELKDLLPP
jgi:hypothetical protein